jgi:hypothetical protein
VETLPESREVGLHFWIILGQARQHADAPHALGLLCKRGERPSSS